MRSCSARNWVLVATALFAVVFAAVGAAQDESTSPGKRLPADASVAGSTLTVADMNSAFAKLEAAIRKLCKIPGAPVAKAGGSANAATREQVIVELDRLYDLAKPHFKFTPHKMKFDPAMLTIKKGRPARAKLEKLITWEFVAKVGPVAASLKPTLTIDEFGDALGFFAARIADLTHMPSRKWSPYINEMSHAPGGGTDKSKTPASKS